jgi:hypothetical protein
MAILPGIFRIIVIAFITHDEATKDFANFNDENKSYETEYGRKHETFFKMRFTMPVNQKFHNQQNNGYYQQKTGEASA